MGKICLHKYCISFGLLICLFFITNTHVLDQKWCFQHPFSLNTTMLVSPTPRTCWEIQCLPYARFLAKLFSCLLPWDHQSSNPTHGRIKRIPYKAPLPTLWRQKPPKIQCRLLRGKCSCRTSRFSPWLSCPKYITRVLVKRGGQDRPESWLKQVSQQGMSNMNMFLHFRWRVGSGRHTRRLPGQEAGRAGRGPFWEEPWNCRATG